ncbi:hypothetical protein BDZ89DRAFT_5457 [Hymenopellis radicata]|nr:hypothetical protein BDZ89DRAFT_5457 [Hymenopellis radicata]
MQRFLVRNPGKIPQELVDIVLDFLDDDLPSLIACATVCRTWAHTAQAHIFSRVVLRRDDGRKPSWEHDAKIQRIQAFCRLISANDHLAPFIHSIELRSKGPALFSTIQRNVQSWWLPLKDTLGPLIPTFTRLKRLELRYERVYGWEAFLAWEGARNLTLGSSCLRKLDLRRVTFEDLASFLRLLESVSTLDRLALQDIAFIESEPPLDAHDPLPIKVSGSTVALKSLSIHGLPRHVYEVIASAFLHPQSPADIRFLRHLELHWYHNPEIIHDVNIVAPFLSSNRGTLEHFSTCESFGPGHLRPLLETGSLKSLQLAAFPTASTWLDRMKETFSGISLHSLHSLTVDVSGQYSKYCLRLDTMKWAALDEILAQAGLRNLTILMIRSQSQYQHYWDLDWVETDDFRSALPSLLRLEALNVELDVLNI